MITQEQLAREAKKLTPWEQHDGLWLKRDDKFAPLGYGGPNGSKLRQLLFLFAQRGNAVRVLTGASALSPQHSMTAFVSWVFGLPSTHVVAVQDVTKHPNTLIASWFGAQFHHIKVGYNPMIQREVQRLAGAGFFVVPYGITTEDPRLVPPFHTVGARQVSNIPPEVSTLYVPAGSCNTLTSVIAGLCRHENSVRRLVSIGIGPSRVEWTRARLWKMGIDAAEDLPFEWDHSLSLHESGYAAYGDRMPETWDGIGLHATYEGKCFRWLRENGGVPADGKTGFWVVGSAPQPEVVRAYLDREEAA